ncbi:MAG: cytochrome C [bacterium]|nr:cytochrome C [bacterium]MCP4964567.1 cytochrome C [bacterium]
MSTLDRILGPRVSLEEQEAHPQRYRLPKALFSAAALLLMVSLLLPYWVLRLDAPQFPDGLNITAYVNRLAGDVVEIEGLNHYVGLNSFEDGAAFERSIAIIAIAMLAGLLLAALYIHSRWVLVLALPALLFPLIFMADLQYWLWSYGHTLDSAAPLANAVGEFTPPIFGPATIAQFETLALPGFGFVLAVIASGLVAGGLVYHRRAFKPLIDAEHTAVTVEA